MLSKYIANSTVTYGTFSELCKIEENFTKEQMMSIETPERLKKAYVTYS